MQQKSYFTGGLLCVIKQEQTMLKLYHLFSIFWHMFNKSHKCLYVVPLATWAW